MNKKVYGSAQLSFRCLYCGYSHTNVNHTIGAGNGKLKCTAPASAGHGSELNGSWNDVYNVGIKWGEIGPIELNQWYSPNSDNTRYKIPATKHSTYISSYSLSCSLSDGQIEKNESHDW